MRTLILGSILGVALAGGAMAAAKDTPKGAMAPAAQPAAATAPTAKSTKAKSEKAKGTGTGVKAADRTPISKACSAQADTKKLHGAERAKFRDACMKKG